MAAILLHQIVFLFTSRFIIDTGSPWAIIGPRAPPPPLLYHFDQGTPQMILTMLPKKKWGALWVSAIFQNCRNENLIWTIYPDIIYIESYFWCLHLFCHGERIE